MASHWDAWPGRPIRDSFRVKFGKKLKAENVGLDSVPASGYQYRKEKELVYHVDVTTYSTTQSAFDSFIDDVTTSNPSLYVYNPTTDTSILISYNGTWNVEDISVSDNGNGTSRVSVSLTQYGTWSNMT